MLDAPLQNLHLGARFARLGSRFLRTYFRHFPLKFGKIWVWDHVARPYVAWRELPVEARTRSGLVLSGPLSDTVHSAVYFFGVWEPALTKFISDSLRPGDIFIDVGANVGVHTMHAARCVGSSGKVHAIEASPTIFAMLCRNVARNELHNVATHNVAVSDRAGVVAVFLHDPSNLGATTLRPSTENLAAPGGPETIAARALPDIVPHKDILRARMIKIDVEGAEWPVLQGLAPLLPKLRNDIAIVVEVSRHALAERGVSIPRFVEFFRTHGYRASRLAGHSAALCINAPRTAFIPLEPTFDVADLVFRRARP